MFSYVSNDQVKALNILPSKQMELVKDAFLLKDSVLLPHKLSISFDDNKFLNTMPVVIPQYNLMAVKIVSRYPGRAPTIAGQILLYDYSSGDLTHILDADWITAARTGAVCATAINALAVKNFSTLAIAGLGKTARASMECILATNPDRQLTIKLLKYKDQADKFIDQFKGCLNLDFKQCSNMCELVSDAEVVVSCVTNAQDLLAQPEWFQPGCLLVPVHTKGFQTCDLVFDRIFADDTAHVENFKFFNRFKYFGELGEALKNCKQGRQNNSERIISYNIGIALHDAFFARHIVQLLKSPGFN